MSTRLRELLEEKSGNALVGASMVGGKLKRNEFGSKFIQRNLNEKELQLELLKKEIRTLKNLSKPKSQSSGNKGEYAKFVKQLSIEHGRNYKFKDPYVRRAYQEHKARYGAPPLPLLPPPPPPPSYGYGLDDFEEEEDYDDEY